jgi:hypothetical protein
MGGRGSGRWRGLQRKTTVEECSFLDISAIRRMGLRPEGKVPVFVKTRRSILRKRKVGYIDYELRETRGGVPVIVLDYTVRRGGELQKVEEPVVLQSTRPYFGGLRWWFTCPLAQRNKTCGLRVGMLYLPYGSLYFGCRHCYGLTYRSCQESHKRDFLADLIFERIPEITAEQAKRVSNLMGS